MNNNTRDLLHEVCSGDILKAQQHARIILNDLSTQKDAQFKKNMLRKLDVKKQNMIELPYNLKELLIAEDMTNFPMERFLVRPDEDAIVKKTLGVLNAADKLAELGISYVPALMLYGESGTGKTMLAKYLAHCANVPFVYVRFSNMVGSLLGSTQSNIGRVFEYARTTPCVLCFDEIDAVGMSRGAKNDVGELNRVVIALMQEMDVLSNNVIVIGTTNRYDRLDPALVRRFSLNHEVKPLCQEEITTLTEKFLSYTGTTIDDTIKNWMKNNLNETETAASITNKCTEFVVAKIIAADFQE